MLPNCLMKQVHRLGASASIQIEIRDSSIASAVRAALLPEITSYKSTRTEVSLDLRDEGLLLEVRSDGVSSLRAVLNSYLRWVLCAVETIAILSEDIEPS